ncbi:MAG: glycosyltransferase [Flavobacteriaceae bacterium]|nr:glycosyltransferase [Flavobacteriaceae bacterium]
MGGVQRVMLDLLKNLPKEKFDLALMLNLYQGELTAEIPGEIRCIYLAEGKESFSKIPLINKLQLIKRRIKLYFFQLFPQIVYRFKVKERYDIEVASGYAEYDMVLNSPDKKSRKIAWFHTDVTYDKNQNRAKERIEKMKKFDHTVFCAFHIRDVIEKKYGVTYPNSSVIYNAVHVEEIREKAAEFKVEYEKEERPVFCSVGRLHSRKGYHMLVDVHSRLIKEGFKHTVVIVGDGEEYDNLKKQIEQKKVEKTIRLLGTKVNPYPYIKSADYFILPTQSEAYPLVINEALALEKPIISTDVGGIPEMITNKKNGILVKYDEEEIYQAMKNFLTQPELVESIIHNVKGSIEKLNPQKIYDQVTEVFLTQYNKIEK